MFSKRIVSAILAVAALGAPSLSWASSPDAWVEFRADVKAKCVAAGKAQGMKTPEVVVHPFGTSTYGVAVLLEGPDKRICVYDKHAKTVELTPGS